jgi:hypothetical protein
MITNVIAGIIAFFLGILGVCLFVNILSDIIFRSYFNAKRKFTEEQKKWQ